MVCFLRYTFPFRDGFPLSLSSSLWATDCLALPRRVGTAGCSSWVSSTFNNSSSSLLSLLLLIALFGCFFADECVLFLTMSIPVSKSSKVFFTSCLRSRDEAVSLFDSTFLVLSFRFLAGSLSLLPFPSSFTTTSKISLDAFAPLLWSGRSCLSTAVGSFSLSSLTVTSLDTARTLSSAISPLLLWSGSSPC